MRKIVIRISSMVVILGMVLSLPGPITVYAQTISTDWPGFRGDEGAGANNTEESDLTPPLEEDWSIDANADIINGHTPLIADNILYITTQEGQICAYALDTQSQSWCTQPVDNLKLQGVNGENVLVSGSLLYDPNQQLLAGLSLSSGQIEWQIESDQESSKSLKCAAPNGDDLFCSQGKQLYKFNLDNHALDWSMAFDTSLDYPVADNEQVYVTDSTGNLTAIPRSGGSQAWQVGGQGEGAHQLMAFDQSIAASSSDGNLYVLNSSDGSPKWEASLGSSGADPCPPAYADGQLFISAPDGAFYAFNAQDGQAGWSMASTGAGCSAPAIANGYVYANLADGSLHALSLSSGAEDWQTSISDPILDQAQLPHAPLAAAGLLLTVKDNGEITAFHSQPSEPEPEPTPTIEAPDKGSEEPPLEPKDEGEPIPEVPSPAAPDDGSTITKAGPYLQWSSTPEPYQYSLEVDDDSDFSSPLISQMLDLGQNSFMLESLTNGSYYWHIRGWNSLTEPGEWSATRSFTVKRVQISAPQLLDPINGDEQHNQMPTFSISPVSGAARYEIQFARDVDFTQIVKEQTHTNPEITPASSLPWGQLYWRARAMNADGVCSSWSDTHSINLTILKTPLEGIHNIYPKAAFAWYAVTGAEEYALRVDDDPALSSPIVNINGLSGTSYGTSEELGLGIWYWSMQVRTAGGWSSWMQPRSFSVVSGLLSAPILTAPENPVLTNDNTPTLTWQTIPDAAGYQVQISLDSNFTSIQSNQTTAEIHFTPASSLPDQTYYWRVAALDDQDVKGQWSQTRSITIDTQSPPIPQLTSPASGLVLHDEVTFTWQPSEGAEAYQLVYDSDEDFSSPDYTSPEINDTSHTPSLDLGQWWWHVRARDEAGNWSGWSKPRMVRLTNALPSAPVILQPGNNSMVSSTFAPFSWESAPNADHYQLQIDESSGFSTPYIDRETDSLTYSPAYLSPGEWYWRIRSFNSEDMPGEWSAVKHFSVEAEPDTLAPSNPVSLESTSHTVSASSNDNTIDMQWSDDASDDLAGVQGYSVAWSNVSYTQPDSIVDLSADTLSATSSALADGEWYFHFKTCDNEGNCAETLHTGPFIIDNTPPDNPTSIESNTHTPDEWSNLDQVTVEWSADADDHGGSGVTGYSMEWDQEPDTIPDTTVDIDASTLEATSTVLTDGDWYFHMQTCDQLGQCSETTHIGPFRLDFIPPTNVSSVVSTSHEVGVVNSLDNTIEMNWPADADNGTGSGIAGYSISWDNDPDGEPDLEVELAADIIQTISDPLGTGDWYFHMRACDLAGNCSSTSTSGPYPLIAAPEEVSGIIAQDTTWGSTNKLYKVTDTVTVAEGVSLTIEPGTVIKFNNTMGIVLKR